MGQAHKVETTGAGVTSKWRRVRVALVAVLGMVLAGCAAMPVSQITELKRPKPQARILLMPMDVELGELSAGGVVEAHAEWTKAALGHLGPALRAETAHRRVNIVEYGPADNPGAADPIDQQLLKMHGAIGRTIMVHQYIQPLSLPTKQNRLDWSLGPAVRKLREKHDADYALFFYIRDSYSSPGRVAVIVIGALLGVGIQGGTQIGFASLVDLETGDVVWFNRLARAQGDLRAIDPARETVRQLLFGFPQ